MPHFRLETSIEQEKIPKDLPVKLCSVLAKALKKPLAYCVATVVGNVNMSMGGEDKPCGQATLMSIGQLGLQQNKAISKAICDCLEKEISLPKDRMYIHFMDASSSDVGFNGSTFHDLLG